MFKEILTAQGYKGLRTGLEVPNYYLHPHDHRKLVDPLGDDLVMDGTNLIGNLRVVGIVRALVHGSASDPAFIYYAETFLKTRA